MAECVVSSVVNNLVIIVREELQLLNGVEGEIGNIRPELDFMRAFLRDADSTTEESCNKKTREWVKHVRNIAYDTEDILDEFMVRLAHRHRHCHGQGGIHSKIFSCFKDLKARHGIASKLQGIKLRVRAISEAVKRYNYENPRGDAALEKLSSSVDGSSSSYDRREDALLLEETELVGIDKPKKKLIQRLLDNDLRFKVVSVVGMGGLGKTTLVKKVYDDVELHKQFKSHAWITVSQSFVLNELLREMIRRLYGEIKQPIPPLPETMRNKELKEMIREFLQERRYVIVLDDVWKIDDWDALRNAFPNNKCGSRVMLTTRKEEVARASSNEFHGHFHELKPLSLEESMSLFCNKTFDGKPCPLHLLKLSHSMLKRCDGLPLAIVAISGVLATKDQNETYEWELVLRSLGAELEGNDRVKSMMKILSLSYDDLPCYLKSCFLYLSIFPEDHFIERMTVIRLWTAEGFVEEKKRRTREEVAEDYLMQLINRSLIQVVRRTADGRVSLCRIHDLLRETILSKPTNQDFVAIASRETISWPERVRHLSVHNKWEIIQENREVSKLRSLLVFGDVDLSSKSSKVSFFCGGLRLLKVLDLRRVPLEIFPEEVAEQFNLRYLSLRDTKLKKLPPSIGKLRYLETLDLKRTFVTELPVEILKLQRLRHLLVYHYKTVEPYQAFHHLQGFMAREGIGGLRSLQKLSYMDVSQGGGNLMREIGTLSQLRRLGILKLRREDGQALFSSIKRLSNLRTLYVTSIEENEVIDLKHLSTPPEYLRRLYLRGRLQSLPQWMPSHYSLARVFLKWSRLEEDPLESLQTLPNLLHLELNQAYDGWRLCFKSFGFQKLKFLNLEKLDQLETVVVEEGSMPNLEKLIIQCCDMLKKLPSGIEHLSKLKLLEFFDMPTELSMRIRDKQGDYGKVAHIQEVYSTHWRGDHWDANPLELSKKQRQNLYGPSTSMANHEPRNWL